jgi:Spy/CpxP family protein refolding chaperone
MRAKHAIVGAALLAVTAAGVVSAQDAPPPPPERPMRMRVHRPGTGLEQGPAMRQRIGRRAGDARGLAFAPRFLLAQRELLELSDEQVAQLEVLDAAAEEQRRQAMEAERASREALDDAWQEPQPDPEAIRRHAQVAMEARQSIQLDRLEQAARAKALLTPEQQSRLQGWVAGRRAGMRQRGMGPGRGPSGHEDGRGQQRPCPVGACR